MSFFTDSEITELREFSATGMDVTATLRAPGTNVFDEATGRNTISIGATRFTGSVALRPLSPSRTPEVGEETRPYRQAMVHLPYTASLPKIDDLLTIDAATRNTELVGEVFRVVGVAFDSDLVSWTLTVEHVAGSRTTPE